MCNMLHLACLKMTEVWIMSDMQPIQEVLIIEIIEKCTPCRIYMKKQLFSDYRWFLFSLWSCQLISPSSNSPCSAGMLYFSIASFKRPCRSRESQVELVCLEAAGREAKWQYPCLNRVDIWWEHICPSWCCRDSLRSQTVCMYTPTISGNTTWAPHLLLAMSETPTQEGYSEVKILTSG